MLTLGTILRATDPEILRQSGKYRSDMFKVDQSKDEHGEHMRVVGTVSGGSEPRHVLIKCYDKTVSVSSQCMVRCTCDLFKYKLEIALAARGSATPIHADPHAPVRTNPHMLPGMCPHLAYIARMALAAQTTRQAVRQAANPKSKKSR